ncbi:MAG TPA: hypothetical protein VKT19_00235, partial [Steroidobacteraceae bacterium]|nr:hypothetical protein [Steroidobacteraceae bacterium]
PVMVGLYLAAGLCVALIGALAHAPTLVAVLATTAGANFCLGAASSGALTLASNIYPTALRSTGIGWAMALARGGQVAGSGVVAFALAAHWSAAQIFLALGCCAWVAALGSLLLSLKPLRVAASTRV